LLSQYDQLTGRGKIEKEKDIEVEAMRSARAAKAAANATNETQTTETVRTVKQAVMRNLLASCPRCIVYSLHLVVSVVAHTPVHPLALQRMTRDPRVYPNLVVVDAPPAHHPDFDGIYTLPSIRYRHLWQS
jgi:hypothetical protein